MEPPFSDAQSRFEILESTRGTCRGWCRSGSCRSTVQGLPRLAPATDYPRLDTARNPGFPFFPAAVRLSGALAGGMRSMAGCRLSTGSADKEKRNLSRTEYAGVNAATARACVGSDLHETSFGSTRNRRDKAARTSSGSKNVRRTIRWNGKCPAACHFLNVRRDGRESGSGNTASKQAAAPTSCLGFMRMH